jgi:hypothetical protein
MSVAAPIVEAPLLSTGRQSLVGTLLTYRAHTGRILLLQRSENAAPWQDMSVAKAHGDYAGFFVRPAPKSWLAYRAIIID